MSSQVTFTEENVKKNAYDFPKLKLTQGERALLTVVENPYMEYVHQIEKPVLDEAGNIAMITKTRFKDQTQYETEKLQFVSNPICLGTKSVLEEKGIDPDNCPACARAAGGEKGFYPKRKFAVHVIKTNTKPNSFDPTQPLSSSLFIWAFTDTIFSQLVDFQKRWGLKTHDLNLGPCEDPQFQRAKLNIDSGTVLDEKARAAIFAPENRAEDPTVFCGTRKTKERLLEDLAQIDDVRNKANKVNPEAGAAKVSTTAALSEGLGALLDEDTSTGAETVSTPEPAGDLDSLFSDPKTDADGWAVDPEDQKTADEAAAKPSADAELDDLLSGL